MFQDGVEKIRLDVGGGSFFTNSLGIGTAAPSQMLHVVGNICATGSIGVCSDVRFKKNISPIASSLDSVSKLRGVSFD
ncbi:MAG: tail fiber domain-containing protein, partial [Planctomycetes bacterium]|nr:tail fiber domain-containing protein [Planctomycetota bacterium]